MLAFHLWSQAGDDFVRSPVAGEEHLGMFTDSILSGQFADRMRTVELRVGKKRCLEILRAERTNGCRKVIVNPAFDGSYALIMSLETAIRVFGDSDDVWGGAVEAVERRPCQERKTTPSCKFTSQGQLL